MAKLLPFVLIVAALGCDRPMSAGRAADIGAPPAANAVTSVAVMREETVVRVGTSLERWALEWQDAPVPACGPAEVDMAITCPCSGFAYGEMGRLDLVRRRPGHANERLALTPLFDHQENPGWREHLAVLQRWPMLGSDYPLADSIDLEPAIRARAMTRVITPRDYDHDGRATEFPLQVGTLPCGKKQAVLIGVSAVDSSLHAFTSVAHPERPLVLPMTLGEQLRQSGGSTAGVEWPCGDHGADTQTEVQLSVSPQGIDGVRSEYQCLSGQSRGRRISSERI